MYGYRKLLYHGHNVLLARPFVNNTGPPACFQPILFKDFLGNIPTSEHHHLLQKVMIIGLILVGLLEIWA